LLEQASEFGSIASSVKRGKQAEASKFEMYFDHQERVKRIPSHRLLAMNRGEALGIPLDAFKRVDILKFIEYTTYLSFHQRSVFHARRRS
jgi:transcriptional accessory protein Tex/SPT6